MGESTERVLAQAYELIESERLAEAEALLKPIVAAEPDNADAWWLYAHAVTDPGEARLALNNVLRIDPGYPGADDLLDSLEAEYPAAAPTFETQSGMQRVTPPPTLPALPDDDDFVDLDAEFDLDDEIVEQGRTAAPTPTVTTTTARERPAWLIPAIVGLLALTIIVALVLLLPRLTGPAGEATTPTAVQQAAQPTDVAVGSPTDIPSASAVEVSGDTESAVQSALDGFELVDGDIGTADTALGTTLLVGVCGSTDSQQRSEEINAVMSALAQASTQIQEAIEAVGVRMTDCSTNSVLNVIAVPLSEAAAFAQGTLGEKAYQARWQPVL